MLHMLIPSSSGGLFTRVISQSAAPWRLNTLDESLAFGDKFARQLGCTSADPSRVAACLLEQSPANLSTAAATIVNRAYFVGDVRSNFAPVVDKVVIADQPLKLFTTQPPRNPPSEMIIGSNYEEGA